jgi:hypothetical protein
MGRGATGDARYRAGVCIGPAVARRGFERSACAFGVTHVPFRGGPDERRVASGPGATHATSVSDSSPARHKHQATGVASRNN